MENLTSSQREYIGRINRVIDYLDKHIQQSFTLNEIAQIANFSPYHFHRIFTALVGETPNDFIKRIRIEKAARLLLNDEKLSITEVGFDCGFSSNSVFSRAFRERFGCSAKEFRKKYQSNYSKNSQVESKNCKDELSASDYFCDINFNQKSSLAMEKNLEVKQMPAMDVIYCRHRGAFNEIGKAYEKLFRWASPRGLVLPDSKCLTVYHDDPEVTAIENIRQDACLIVGQEVKVEGEIGKMTVPKGKYFVGHFEIPVGEAFTQAWNSVCLGLAENGYQPDDRPSYELYHNDHKQHPEGKFIVDICMPIKPL